MNRTRTRRLSATATVVACIALVVAACGGGDSATDDSTPAGTSPTSDTAASVDGGPVTDAPTATDGDETTDEPASGDAPPVSEGQLEEDVVDEPTDPVAGGTVRFGIEADVDGLNPTGSALSAPGLTMANAVFDTLAAFDEEGNVVPYLAESIEPVDGDTTRWRLVVREGVLFHDGTPLTAEAVQINFETQLANPLVGLSLGPYFPAEGASAVVDDRTIEYSMLEPNAVFPAWLTSQLGMVASPTWLAAATEDATLNQEPVGTGPFVFDSRTPGSQTRVVRNDAWWGGEVYLDAVEFWTVADPADRADLLLGGELNGLHTTDPATVGELTADDSLQNIIDETGEEQFVMLNTTAAPFDDARARQALALSAPLDTYRQLIGLGIARGADQMFIPESKYYNPAVVQQGDDPDAAAALAAEYCAEVPDNCSDGRIDIEFQHTGPSVVASREADILAQGWGAAFNVAFDELVQDEHIQQVVFGQYEAAMWRQFGSLEPALNRHVLMCRTVGEGLSLNFPRFCSEERDALILDAQAQVDPAARIPDWQAVVQDMNDAFTYVFLLHTIWDTALASSVRGVCERTSPEGVPLRCAVNGVSWFDSAWIDG